MSLRDRIFHGFTANRGEASRAAAARAACGLPASSRLIPHDKATHCLLPRRGARAYSLSLRYRPGIKMDATARTSLLTIDTPIESSASRSTLAWPVPEPTDT